MLINRGRKVRGKDSGFLCPASQPDTDTLTCTQTKLESETLSNVSLRLYMIIYVILLSQARLQVFVLYH